MEQEEIGWSLLRILSCMLGDRDEPVSNILLLEEMTDNALVGVS